MAHVSGDRVAILHNIGWETYEQLLADLADSPGRRLTYDDGVLEIAVPSLFHEEPLAVLRTIVTLLTADWEIETRNCGSVTIKRADLRKGFEPDNCFYIAHEPDVRGKRPIDFATDPPPDLVIEVDVTSQSIDKFPIFAAMGIPEVWRYFEERVSIHLLDGRSYREARQSLALPPVTGEVLTRLVALGLREPNTALVREVRRWARSAGR